MIEEEFLDLYKYTTNISPNEFRDNLYCFYWRHWVRGVEDGEEMMKKVYEIINK